MTPLQAEQISMPAYERIWLDEMKCLMPEFCAFGQQDKPDPVAICGFWPFDLTVENDQQLA
jgi:hypothetical protein